jgi:putative copper resistance protein D
MPATDRLPSWTPTTLQLLRWGPLGLVVVALAVTAGALAYGGGADPLTIGDPGPVVRWGLPLARLSFDLTAALTVGALCIAVFAWSARCRSRRAAASPGRSRPSSRRC